MGRKEIIRKLAERIYGNTTENEIKKCADICDTLVDIFTDALVENKKILWKGFLNIEVVERAARKGRHPQTNEIVTFPPTKSINCKISKSIKDIINGK